MHDSLILCLSRRCLKRSDGQSPRTFNLKETHFKWSHLIFVKAATIDHMEMKMLVDFVALVYITRFY